MEWSKGYTAEYYIEVLNPNTWRTDPDALGGGIVQLTGGSISRGLEGIRDSASITCTEYPEGVEEWVRIWLNTEQNGASAHEALFTGIATSPSRQYDGRRSSSNIECYSVLKPVEDVLLLRGWYAAAGKTGGDIIKSLLSVTPAPVIVEPDSPAITDHIIAGDGETRLTMVDRILDVIDWRLWIDGDGTIHVGPKPRAESYMFDPLLSDVVETQVTVTADLFEAPNVFAAFGDDLTAVATDETSGPLSIANRGREVWASDQGVDLAENETLLMYARRKLKEAQDIRQTASYTRRYIPGLYPGDLVSLRYPAQELNGLYTITSQNITLGYAARTQEEVKKWTA